MENQLIILMAGRATRLAPLSYILPKGLLTINQKPACFNMIADLVKNRVVDDITFVVSPSNEAVVKEFAKKSFGCLNLNFVVQNNPQGPLHAFQLCKDYIKKPTILLLGDTLCETNLDYSYDWLGYKLINDNSHSRWCLIKTDSEENVTEIIDKPEYTPETNKVLIGYYNFTDPELLCKCLSFQYNKIRGELQLSSLIERYGQEKTMKGREINSWFDTGTLKDYNNTLAQNVSGRSFNKFHLNEFGVLTKVSSYTKLKSEIAWLKKIKEMKLDYLIPNFYGEEIKTVDGKEVVSYKTEFVNGSTLTEYFNYYNINQSNLDYIFRKLIKSLSKFWEVKPSNDFDIKKYAQFMYFDKTLERIKQWDRKDILEQEYIFANGEKLQGFYQIFDKLKGKITNLVENSAKYTGIIHGDSCFSNVIFFPQTGTFKFIDPRGNFGVDTIYGDFRYDVAKIRHNYHGLYDYITLNLFRLKEKASNDFEYNFFTKEIPSPSSFDAILEEFGFDVNEIELLEGLLFISMIPLHNDNPEAQILYYITGLKCLNNQVQK